MEGGDTVNDESATNEGLLAQQAARESNARTYPRNLPMAIQRADGIELEDVDGNTYYDCLAGAGVFALGHNHPVVVEAIERALQAGVPMQTLDVTTPIKERFVDTLFDSLPPEFAESARIQFCSPAGTDAVEAALKLTKTATGNRSVLAFRGGYHGMSGGALGLMGDIETKAPISGLMPDVHHLPYPYEYRSPFGVDEDDHRIGSQYVERLLDDPKSGIVDPAAMILETIQGEGGSVPAPNEWLREMRRITRERDIPLIIDDIQAGLGRTGERYSFEHADITPDVLVLSKAIGGGLPLSVVVYHESLDAWKPGAHAGTFRGNQLAMAAGRATIEYIMEHDLSDHAATMGERFAEQLRETASAFAPVGDVRGRGLMLGVEFVDADAGPDTLGSYPPDGDLARRVQAACFERGLVIERGGPESATIRFLPPLVISSSEVDAICDIFHEAVRAAVEPS